MEATAVNDFIQLALLFIGTGILTCIVVIVALIRCGKNHKLSKTERGIWITAQLVFMFPSFIYLIIIEKSWWWRAVGIVSLITSTWLMVYIVEHPSLTNVPDLGSFVPK